MKKVKTWAEGYTCKTDLYWMKRIEKIVQRHCFVIDGFDQKSCNPVGMLMDLSVEVAKTLPSQRGGDGNLMMASVLSYLLAKWFVLVTQAKGHDPHRSMSDRKEALSVLDKFLSELPKIGKDLSEARKIFPGQEWDPPFAKEATDGSYV